MAFTTPTFLLFFAVCFALYWLARKRDLQNALLVAVSYLFYATWDVRCGLLLLATSLVDYCVGIGLGRTKSLALRRVLLSLSIVSDLGVLSVFKYFNFFAANFSYLARSVGWQIDPTLANILLPIGISFYTFKSLGYTIDVYRRHAEPTSNLIAYLAYVAFFPQLLAGPIDRANNLLRQLLAERHFDYALAVSGCRQVLQGLFKKMVLADHLAPIVNLAYAQPQTTPGPGLLFATICFAFQIYFDFSAYSDIAIGAGSLLGVSTAPNFAYPYFSQSPAEFWRRWHISLTSWFRDYVFFSLGGMRRSKARMAFNLLLTFLLSGLWHGPSWNFILWGGINGVAVLPVLAAQRKRSGAPRAPSDLGSYLRTFLKISLTFLFICLTWVFFRAPDITVAFLILRKIFSEALNIGSYRSIAGLLHPYVDYPLAGPRLVFLLLVFVVVEWIQKHRLMDLNEWPGVVRWLAYNGVIFLILYYGTYVVNQFYYYQF